MAAVDLTSVAAAAVAGVLSAGAWQFASSLLRRKPELARLDAETESLRLQTADRLIVQLDVRWQRAEERNQQLEQELARREATIEDLEERLRAMRRQMQALQDQLHAAEQELATLRTTDGH